MSGASGATQTVRVAVRCRPLSSKEVEDGRQRIVDVDLKARTIAVKNPKVSGSEPPKTFTFDHVYDWNTIQKNLYNETASPIVDSVLEGYNGTIFAYGQTGTGKTHTMEGVQDDVEQRGIIPNSFQHVFDAIETSEGKEFLVQASFLEIYNEDVRDLLAKNPNNKLELKETVDTGVYVKDLTKFVVKGVQEISNVLKVGKKNRTVGATLMNQDSSRSHSIFTITVETSDHGADGHIRMGKLNLVDLAGSERQSKTGATGDRLKEATKINLSLSALGNVISALVDGKSGHIPYRDSKLTRLLQDSLGGNTKTVMVANIGPADYNFDETMSTLRYANRAKNIKNKPRINEDPKDAMLREFQEEIARLKQQLGGGGEGGGGGGGDEVEEVEVEEEVEASEARVAQIKAQMKKDMEKQMTRGMTEEEVQATMKEVEEKAGKELQKLLSDKQRTEEEKARIKEALDAQHAELEAHNVQLEKERAERETLEKRVKAMESKLLGGNVSLAELTEKQQEEKEALRKKLDDRRALEEEQQQRIQELEAAQEGTDDKYGSLQEEAEVKTRKLKKLFARYQAVKSEIEDMQEEFSREREDLLDSIRTLTRQMKLKDVVIDNFVPTEEAQKVMNRAHWFDEEEVWVLQRLSRTEQEKDQRKAAPQRPVSAAGQKRPVSDYARMVNAMGDLNPRFKTENILSLELDMPERTTYDYDTMAAANPRVQAALDAAFSEDSEMVFVSAASSGSSDKLRNVAMMEERGGSRGAARPQSAARRRPGTATRRSTSRAA